MNHIYELAKALKLPFIKENFQEEIARAEVNKIDHETFLDCLLTQEMTLRREKAIKTRIRNAKFPYQITFHDYDINHYSLQLQNRLKKLETLEFIDNKENIILIGNPGVGKTALSICLGYKACLNLKNVLFINATDFLIQIREAMSQEQILRYKRKFQRYDLVIIDELGYVSYDRSCGEVLFNLLSSRNQKGSMIITSNLTVDKWNEVFQDSVMTAAIVDRLAYKSHLLDMSGDSYRVKSTLEWQKDLNDLPVS